MRAPDFWDTDNGLARLLTPFGLIYADAARPAGLELQERELALIRTLRNQAVIAFRHAG